MNPNPYMKIRDWFFDECDIDEEMLENVSNMIVLSMFSKLYLVTVFLNDNFNNIYIHSLDKMDLLQYLKSIVKDYSIKKNELYPIYPKRDLLKKDKIVLSKFPQIKKSEIELLLQFIKKSKYKLFYSDYLSE